MPILLTPRQIQQSYEGILRRAWFDSVDAVLHSGRVQALGLLSMVIGYATLTMTDTPTTVVRVLAAIGTGALFLLFVIPLYYLVRAPFKQRDEARLHRDRITQEAWPVNSYRQLPWLFRYHLKKAIRLRRRYRWMFWHRPYVVRHFGSWETHFRQEFWNDGKWNEEFGFDYLHELNLNSPREFYDWLNRRIERMKILS